MPRSAAPHSSPPAVTGTVRPVGQADRPLRAVLIVALAALLLTALIAATTPMRAQTVVASAPNAYSADAVTGTRPPTSRTIGTTAKVTPRRVSAGCGLSLGAPIPPVPVGHCTILEIGDSLGSDVGWGLNRELPANSGLDTVLADRSSTGLANTSFYDWPSHLSTLLQDYHPQVVLVCLGGNDEQGLQVGGSAVQFPTPAWQDAYLGRVRALINQATSSGAFIVWVGLPVMQPPSYSDGIQVLDDLYQRAAGNDPNAAFLSTWSLFSGADGRYRSRAEVDGSWADLRQADGIHYSLAGENVVATFVIRQIASIFHVQLAPSDPAVVAG